MKKPKIEHNAPLSVVNIRIHCSTNEKKSKFSFDRSKVKTIKELIGKIMIQLKISSSSSKNEEWQLRLGRHVIIEEVDDIQENDNIYLLPKISYASNNLDKYQNENDSTCTVSEESSSDSDYDDLDTNMDNSFISNENTRKAEDTDSSCTNSNDRQRNRKRLHQKVRDDVEEIIISSDDSYIEDVTSEYQKNKQQLTQDLINEAEKLYNSDDVDDDNSYSSSSNKKYLKSPQKIRRISAKNEEKKNVKKSRNRKSADNKDKTHKQFSPIQVIIQEKDVPIAPGCKSSDQDHQSSAFDDSQTTLTNTNHINESVKNRIFKLLNTGFHENSNENEAKNAMKLAQRLMQRHNINQALLLQEKKKKDSNADDKELLKGGLVTVELVHQINKVKTKPMSAMARWIAYLIYPVRFNFKVEAYKTVGRRPPQCSVTFYGIYTNAQLAAYAFKIACERIASMTTVYNPPASSSRASPAFTRRARLSYALGIVEGLTKDVEANIKRQEQRRKEKLNKTRQAVRKGEAYEESDDDDDDGWITNADVNINSNSSTLNSIPNNGSMNELRPDSLCKNKSGQNMEKTNLDENEIDVHEKAKIMLEDLEKEETATLALIDHHKKIAENILKEANVKVHKAAKRAKIAFDHQSYQQGIKDAKEIDLDQKAIRGDINVVKEEIRSRTKT